MRNYDILFDRTDREIHFTRANCTRNWGNTFFNLNTSILFDEPQKEKIPINLDSNRAFEVINEINIYDENNNNNENCTPTPEKNITKDVEKNTNQTIENEENIKDQNFSNSPKKIENDNITIDPEQKNNNSSIFLLNQNNQDGNYSKNDTIQIFCKENSEREG